MYDNDLNMLYNAKIAVDTKMCGNTCEAKRFTVTSYIKKKKKKLRTKFDEGNIIVNIISEISCFKTATLLLKYC